MQQERKKKNQFLVRRRRKKRNKEKETEISLSLSLLQENFSEKGNLSIDSSASPDDNASGSLFVPHCCCCRCMARLDDGCCFVFSLLILSKQLAVYSFFLFRFIGASICISLAIPFLSIDPGWLGEDRPAAAFTLQVNLPDRRLFHSLFTRQGRAYISIGCLFLLLSYVRDLATYVADQSNRRGSRDEGKKLDRPSHTVLRNAFFFLDCVSFHRITLAPVPSLLIPALIGRRMTGH